MEPMQSWQGQTDLVIVACHAVYLGCSASDVYNDDCWALEAFQKGEPPYFVEHIKAGIEKAEQNTDALLIFSGGQTRVAAGPISEAQSYWAISEQLGLWQSNVKDRTTTEEFARDSFENLLFGICRFHECTGRWPVNVSVLSWQFKARRFNLHREAIRFPFHSFTYVGVNNPADLDLAEREEQLLAIEPFARDPYGTNAGSERDSRPKVNLAEKRRLRNPFSRTPPYETSCHELAELLRHRGPQLFDGSLPWTR